MKFDPDSIERELQTMLNRSSETGVRTSLFNLVIFAPEEAASLLSEMTEYLLGKRPARIIYIYQTDYEKSDIAVTARCYPKKDDDKKICFEEIVIHNGSDDTGQEPASWTPFLIRELSTIVLWLGPLIPFPSILLKTEELIDKLLIYPYYNNKHYPDPVVLYRELTRVKAENLFTLPVIDFTWEKISTYRRWAARLFDIPDNRDSLFEIRRILISGLHWPEAFLFFLWMAGRLDWKNGKRINEKLIFSNNKNEEISLEYIKEADKDCSIFFFTSSKQYCIKEESGHYTSYGTPEKPLKTALIHHPQPGEILLKELDTLSFDPLFYEAVEKGRQLY